MDESGGRGKESSLIVTVFVSSVWVGIDSRVVEHVARRMGGIEGEFRVAARLEPGFGLPLGSLFVRLEAALGVFKGQQTEHSSDVN